MKYRLSHILAMTLLVGACSVDEDEIESHVETIQAPLMAQSGSILAEYDREHEGTSVHAQFVKVRGIPASEALDALEIWSPSRELAKDSCSLRSPTFAVPDDVNLQLLDVGAISVAFDGEQVELEGRELPDLLQEVSGVIYGNDRGFDQDRISVPYSPGIQYEFQAPGEETGPLNLLVVAPEFPSIRVVDAQPIDETSTFTRREGEDFRMEWDASVHGSELYLDISSTLGPDRPRLRCRVDDDGNFTLPESIIEQLRDESSNLEVVLRRVNITEATLDGFGSVQAVFSAKDQVTLILP